MSFKAIFCEFWGYKVSYTFFLLIGSLFRADHEGTNYCC